MLAAPSLFSPGYYTGEKRGCQHKNTENFRPAAEKWAAPAARTKTAPARHRKRLPRSPARRTATREGEPSANAMPAQSRRPLPARTRSDRAAGRTARSRTGVCNTRPEEAAARPEVPPADRTLFRPSASSFVSTNAAARNQYKSFRCSQTLSLTGANTAVSGFGHRS